MQEIEILGVNETIYYDVVEGLPVYIFKNEKVKGMIASLNVLYGSIHQEFKVQGKNYKMPRGIAHFLEHLCFYEDDNKTATDFYSQYGSEVNAFTTFKYTSYHVYATSYFKENILHLLDFVLTPYFTKKLVNKERGIILEETRMDEDLPESNLYYTHYRNLFNKYNYKEQITGTVDDVKKITLEDILLVYNTFYHPENMFLVVCGNVNQHEVMKYVENHLQEMNLPPFVNPKIKKYREIKEVNKEYEEIYGNVEKPKVKISLKMPLSNFKEFDSISLRAMMLLIVNNNFGPTSDLKEYLMEEELINYMGAKASFIDDYIVITVTLETDYPSEVIDKIKDSLNNLTITNEDLKRKIHGCIANLVLDYDDISNVNDSIQADILTFNKIINNMKEILENINLKDVLKVIEKIDTKNMAITVLKPNQENIL